MKRNIIYRAAMSVVGLGFLPAIVAAADYSGHYDSAQINVVIAPAGTNYGGEIRMGEQKFPLAAHEDGNHLTGVFTSGGARFVFTAMQQGDDLTLETGGKTYALHRHSENPLAAVQPAGAAPVNAVAPAVTAAPAQPNADALANYAVMNSTDVGRSMMREIPEAKTTLAAMKATFPDLARYFGGWPKVLGSYEDQKDHKSAFASFSAQMNGQPIKGFVTAKMRDGGAVVFVVFGNANATKAQWTQLTARPATAAQQADGATGTSPAPAQATGGERSMKELMAEVPLTPYSFPDRTGAIGLAEGYTTNAQTESNLIITGPAGQKIKMAMGGQLQTPAIAQRGRGGPPPAAFNIAVAAYSDDPATALGNIIVANNALSQRRGGPVSTPEKVIKVVPIPAKNGGHAAQITYDVAINDQGGAKHYRVLIQFSYTQPMNGSWGYYTSLQLMAPQETFEHDLPIMMAQAFSLSENADVIMAKSRTEIAAANARAKAQRDATQAKAEAGYARTKSIEAASAAQSKQWADVEADSTKRLRTADDFDETIRGVRTVEDTRTGEQTSVNLADVHDIVDHLNEIDPGRYKEIPLRDESHPLPGHENDVDYLAR